MFTYGPVYFNYNNNTCSFNNLVWFWTELERCPRADYNNIRLYQKSNLQSIRLSLLYTLMNVYFMQDSKLYFEKRDQMSKTN